MCTMNDDGTVTPCGGLWPEGSHEAAWHPHANCPTCASEHEVMHNQMTRWLIEQGHTRAWSDLAAKLLKTFRVIRRENT